MTNLIDQNDLWAELAGTSISFVVPGIHASRRKQQQEIGFLNGYDAILTLSLLRIKSLKINV